jgi:acyl-coenzyme A thioesterase PaaI-like protein
VSERHDAARDAEQRVGDARRALTTSTRALLEAVLAADHLDDADLATATTMIDALTAGLREGSPPPESRPSPAERRRYGDYLPRSLLTGLVHPISPGAAWTFEDGVLHVRATLSQLYEGPPGYVHGGFVSLAFDELFGMVNVLNGLGGLTGRLTVRYRRPTPLGEELRMTAWIERHAGRTIRTRGTIHVGDGASDLLTAEAEGLFVMLQPETARDYFGD